MIGTKSYLTAVLTACIAFQLPAQQVNEPHNLSPEWTQPYEPFRIVGNLYYVGTYDLACYLITTSKGNILINTGLAASAATIKENIEALGFKLGHTKVLLTTQAHYDHVAALAAIKKYAKASLMADEKDVAALEDGGRSDYELGKYGATFEPVKVDRKLRNGDTIELGGTKITMLHHPGHTKGSCSYMLDVKEKDKTYRVLIVNLPSIITDRKFSEIDTYPDIAKDYRYTLDALKTLTFDLWLSSHASQFNLHEKRKPRDAYDPEAFRDRKGYDQAVNDLEAAFQRKMSSDQK